MHAALRRNLLFVALVLIMSTNAVAQITSDFATSADGWTAPNSSTGVIAYNATGGNPTGNVSAIGVNVVLGATTLSVPLYFVAPAKFIGNKSGYMNGTILFDLQQSSTGGTSEQMAEVIISSGTTTLYYFPPTIFSPAVAPSWTSFSVTLNQNAGYWKTANSSTATAATDADILFILTNFNSLQVRGRFRTSVNTGRLDNVMLLPPITIDTQPTSTAVCESFNATLTTAASDNTNISYHWQKLTASVWNDLTNGGGYSGVTTASMSVNTTGNVGTGSYRCRISGTGAIDVFTSVVTITVNTRPAAPGVTNGAACAPGSVTLTASGGTNGQYRWYTLASGGTAIAGQTNSTYAPTLTGTTTYYAAINNGTCESNRTAVTGTINTPPNAPTTTGNSSCATGALTLTAAGGTNGQYRWYTLASGGTAITGQTNSTYSPTLTGTTTYYAAIDNGTCESNRTAVTGTINTPPNAPTTTGNASCTTGTLTLTAAGGTNGQYRWYTLASGGTAIAGQTNSTYAPSLTGTTTYYAAINNGTCESTRTAVTGTINTPPTAPTTTGNASCATGTLTLTAAGGTNGQYRWYTLASGGTAIAGQTNSTYAPTLTGTTTYYAAINNGTCESTRTAVTGTINTPPNAPTTTGNFSCTTGALTLTAAGGTNGQYRWYTLASGGAAIAGQTNSTYAPSLTGTTTYYTAINNGTCESTRTAVTGTINTPPTAPTTAGNASCATGALTLTAAGGTAGQYRWYTLASGGTAIAGQTNATYTTPSLSTTTTYYAAINNGTCESTRKAVTATINTPPAAPATTGSSSCIAGTFVLTASGGANGQYRWYTVASGGTAIAGQTNSTYTTPSLSVTTTYYASINNGTCESTRAAVTATVGTTLTPPSASGTSSCSAGTFTLTASGGTNGQYRWYAVATGGSAIAGQNNNTYTTPSLTTSTTYYVSLNNGSCESTRIAVAVTINTPPAAPTVTGNASCTAGTLTLTAAGGTSGQYRWYTDASATSSIAGETNAAYTTPALTTTTTYYVAINNGTCESTRTPVTATIGGNCGSNNPPVIQSSLLSTQIEGKVSLDLNSLISDQDNNLDLSTLQIISPPASGASASIDSKFFLIIDYAGILFSGTEKLTIQVCDFNGACTQRELSIEVAGDIIVYNAISPNNDGKNEFLFLEYINILPDTKKNKVSIFGRWGDLVFDVIDYDNATKSFKGLNNNGNELPSGTYFYKIEFVSNHKPVNGFLTLKR